MGTRGAIGLHRGTSTSTWAVSYDGNNPLLSGFLRELKAIYQMAGTPMEELRRGTIHEDAKEEAAAEEENAGVC